MHHIFPKNAPVVHGKEDQIKSTVKSRTFSILSPSKHASVFQIRFLGVSQYHRAAQVLSQHSLPSDNCLLWKRGSLLNFFLMWLRRGSPPERADPKPLAASHNYLPSTFCNSNISGQKQRMLCHVIILCHYMGSSQTLLSEIQARDVIKEYLWSACWLRVGNGTHAAALSPNLSEDTKGFAMHSSCYACKTCHSKTNRLKISFSVRGN